MVGPARIKGTKLSITVGTQELHCQSSKVIMDNEEASDGVTTFCDAEAGGAFNHFLDLTSLQSTATDSFWSYLWDNPATEAAFVYRPHGNAVATANEPHFTGTLKTPGKKPTLGGEAGKANDFTFDTRLEIIGEPVKDLGAISAPAITAVSDDAPAVDQIVNLAGTRFTGTTGVTVDGIAAPFSFISDGILVIAIPTGAAGPSPIVVTNAGGASAPFPVTV